MQRLGADRLGKLVLTSTTVVTLNPPASGANLLTIGGKQYAFTSKTLSTATSGFGGIDTGVIAISSFYYVYAVVSAGVPGLVASLSSSAPTGFTSYKKVGAFYTNPAATTIFKAYYFGEINNLVYSAAGTAGATGFAMSPAGWIATQTVLGTGRTEFGPAAGIFSVDPQSVACPQGASQGQHLYLESSLFNSIIVRGSNATPALSNTFGPLIVTKAGIDAIQPDWSA